MFKGNFKIVFIDLDSQPWNTDRPLYQCDNTSCKEWLHEECLIAAKLEGLCENLGNLGNGTRIANGSFLKSSRRKDGPFNVTPAAGSGTGPGGRPLVYRCAGPRNGAEGELKGSARCLFCWFGLELTPSDQRRRSGSAEDTTVEDDASRDPCWYDFVTFPGIPERHAEHPVLAKLQMEYNDVEKEQRRLSSEIIKGKLHADPRSKKETTRLWKRRRELCTIARSLIVTLGEKPSQRPKGRKR